MQGIDTNPTTYASTRAMVSRRKNMDQRKWIMEMPWVEGWFQQARIANMSLLWNGLTC